MSKHRKSSRRGPRKTPLTFSSFMRRPAVLAGIVAVLAIAIYLVVVYLNKAPTGLSLEVDVDTAYSMYQEGAFVLDVREQSEWDEYHAPGTTLIPLGELASRLNELPRDRQIVVVCRSDNRSQQGRDILLDAGFTQVTSMSGGLKAWRTAGYPIEP
jgi:rhodanese-related sulfurtransferase